MSMTNSPEDLIIKIMDDSKRPVIHNMYSKFNHSINQFNIRWVVLSTSCHLS